uniref:Uncharacterized protein n=1 Tax=Arundo donax TaxID=35708 RepID=A0A0A8Y392_ARUDO
MFPNLEIKLYLIFLGMILLDILLSGINSVLMETNR